MNLVTFDPGMLGEGEKALARYYRHPFALLRDAFPALVLLALPYLGPWAVARYMPERAGEFLIRAIENLPEPLVAFVEPAWWLIVLMMLAFVVSDFLLDVWVLTDRKIADVEQFGFFSRKTSSFPLENIQDITISSHGIFPTLLHYGDLHVQTAGVSEKFVIYDVPFPQKVQRQIWAARDKRSIVI